MDWSMDALRNQVRRQTMYEALLFINETIVQPLRVHINLIVSGVILSTENVLYSVVLHPI